MARHGISEIHREPAAAAVAVAVAILTPDSFTSTRLYDDESLVSLILTPLLTAKLGLLVPKIIERRWKRRITYLAPTYSFHG